jgi:hypothetical protein
MADQSSVIQDIQRILDMGSGVFSNFADSRDRGWWRGAYVNNLNFGRQGYDDWNRLWQDRTNPVWANAARANEYMSTPLYENFSPYLNRASGFYDQIPGLQEQYGQPYFGGGIANSLDDFGELADGGKDIFRGGGWSPAGGGLMDFASRLQNGETPEMGQMSQTGRGMLENWGQSDFTNALRDMATTNVRYGGQTDLLRNAANYADSIFQTGGATDFTKAAQARAIDKLGSNPVLSMEDAVAMSRDQAGTAALQRAKAARRQALARGGGPGTVVANGATNEAMGDFADQAMQAEAAAGRDAMLKQQELGLQDVLQSAKLGEGSQGLENNRLLTALGLFPEIQRAATGQLSAAGNLGLGGDQSDLGRATLGGSLLNNYLGAQLGAGNLGQETLRGMNQYALGAGNLANSANQNRGALALGSQQAGRQNFESMLQAYLGALGAQGSAMNNGFNWFNSQFTNPSLQIGEQAMKPLQTFGGNSSQLWAGRTSGPVDFVNGPGGR